MKVKKWQMRLLFLIICIMVAIIVYILFNKNREESTWGVHTDGLTLSFEQGNNICYVASTGKLKNGEKLIVDENIAYVAFTEDERIQLCNLFEGIIMGRSLEKEYEYNMIINVDGVLLTIDTKQRKMSVVVERTSSGWTTYNYELSKEQNSFFEMIIYE
ncbi:MAG: hypothetical protein IJP13_04290 [Lachnospiraceae bacterium]|nr:hypothetical protein [Lachnospiraceae bacterium]